MDENKKLRIKRLWLEYEFIYADWAYGDFICDHSVIEDTFIKQEIIWEIFDWRIVPEYYENQIEFNIPFLNKTETKKRMIDISRSYLDSWSPYLILEWVSPEFVWTHVHIEFSNSRKPILNIKNKVLEYCLTHILKMFKMELFENKKRKKQYLLSLLRIISNHNIWINYDTNICDKDIEINLNYLWLSYVYTNGRNKWKYQPVYWSNKIKNIKWHTLELRLLPNYFSIYYPNKIWKLINDIPSAIDVTIWSIKNIILLHQSFILLYLKKCLQYEFTELWKDENEIITYYNQAVQDTYQQMSFNVIDWHDDDFRSQDLPTTIVQHNREFLKTLRKNILENSTYHLSWIRFYSI